MLGNVPVASVRADVINGDPDITTNTRPQAVIQAMERVNTADLILHSQTLREMRATEHQYNKLLAAHVLSSSSANSGVVIQTLPRTRAQTPDGRFRHILRLRMGVPCAMPLAQWRCNCSALAENTHLHPGVSAKAGEAVKRKKYKGAVQGFVVEAGGRLGPAAKKFSRKSSSTRWWSAKCQRRRGKQRQAR